MNSLALAHGIKSRMSKGIKCAHGGPISCSAGCYAKGGEVENEKLHPTHEPAMNKMKRPSAIVESIMAKKMAAGGEVEDADFKEDYPDDDFLTADEDLEAPERGYPDADGVEDSDRKGILSKIMSRMHSKAYGK